MTARPVTNFIRQTDRQTHDRHTTDTRQTDRQNFHCIFLVLEVQNVEKKSISSIEKKTILETVVIYVLRDSGHIKIPSVWIHSNHLMYTISFSVCTLPQELTYWIMDVVDFLS